MQASLVLGYHWSVQQFMQTVLQISVNNDITVLYIFEYITWNPRNYMLHQNTAIISIIVLQDWVIIITSGKVKVNTNTLSRHGFHLYYSCSLRLKSHALRHILSDIYMCIVIGAASTEVSHRRPIISSKISTHLCVEFGTYDRSQSVTSVAMQAPSDISIAAVILVALLL